MTRRVVDVLMPVAVDQVYSYRVPEGLDLAPGDVVTAPLGARATAGVVWAENKTPNPRFDNRLKDIKDKLDIPPLRPELRKFVDWVSEYTLASRGMVLRMCLRRAEHLGPAREKVGVRLAGNAPKRMTAARDRVLRLLADGMTRAKSEAAHEAGVSAGVIDGLIDEGALEALLLPPEPVAAAPDPDHEIPEFTDAQRAAARNIARDHRQGRLFGDADRRRHRLGQNRSLFRGGGRNPAARPAGLDLDAGNRADGAIPRPLFRAFWRAAGRMAFAAFTAQARAHLGRIGGGRDQGRGRRAFGVVSALRRPRLDRRRRGT